MGRAAPSLVCISPTDQRTTTHTSLLLSRLRKFSYWYSLGLSVCPAAGRSVMDGTRSTPSSLWFSFSLFCFCLTASDCQACEEADTYENIMDNYCRADFGVYFCPQFCPWFTWLIFQRFFTKIVARTKLRRVRRNKVSGKKSKMLKMSLEMREEWRRNQRPNLIMELGDDCCTDHFNTVALSRTAAGGSNGGDRFLVMGVQRNGQLVPTLVLPWTKRSKVSSDKLFFFSLFLC